MNSNNSNKIVTVIGGSGFVGRHVVGNLAKRGYRVRVACRRPDLAGHVQLLGAPGQVMPMQANVRFPKSLEAACDGAMAVINLTGVLFSGGSQTFDAIHVFGAEACAKAAKAQGAKLYIHMSAIGANAESESEYGRSKAAGEAAAKAAFPGTMILRPSIVFGPEDNFFNQFANMAKFAPALPLIGGGQTLFQPVYVGDVAEAMANLIDRGLADGKTYELGGPERKTFQQLLQFTLDTIQRKRLLLPLPWFFAKFVGSVMSILPKPLITLDQVRLLETDNIVSDSAVREERTLQGLGISPQSLASIVPSYLYRYRTAGQFTAPKGMPE